MHTRRAHAASLALLAAWVTLAVGLIAGCSALPSSSANAPSHAVERIVETVGDTVDKLRHVRVYDPLSWNADEASLVNRQGMAGLWGTCGECALANTLNLATGSAYAEADIVDFALERGLCEPSTGGMSTDHMLSAYEELLPADRMGIFCYDGPYALTIDEMADKIDRGSLLDVSVYGEMMREGGHVGEGDVYTTHWIVLHRAVRDETGAVAGFDIVDSASDMTFISTQALSDVHFGHDGTTMIDPTCLEVYGWKYANGAPFTWDDVAPPRLRTMYVTSS